MIRRLSGRAGEWIGWRIWWIGWIGDVEVQRDVEVEGLVRVPLLMVIRWFMIGRWGSPRGCGVDASRQIL